MTAVAFPRITASLPIGDPQVAEARDLIYTTDLPGAWSGIPIVVVSANGGGLFAFDVSDRDRPVALDEMTGPPALVPMTSLCQVGDRAYGAVDGAITIYDISDPESLSYVDALQDATNLAGAQGIVAHPAGNVLYTAGASVDKLVAVSITADVLAVETVLTPANFDAPIGVAINEAGTRLYAIARSRLFAFDTTIADTPVLLGSGATGGTQDGQYVALSNDGLRAFTCSNSIPGRIEEWDISTTAPDWVAGVEDVDIDRPLGIAQRNGLAVVPCQGDDGLCAFIDVTEPGAPALHTVLYQPRAGTDTGSGELNHCFSAAVPGDGYAYIAVAGGGFGRFTIVRLHDETTNPIVILAGTAVDLAA